MARCMTTFAQLAWNPHCYMNYGIVPSSYSMMMFLDAQITALALSSCLRAELRLGLALCRHHQIRNVKMKMILQYSPSLDNYV